jgi:hypothetical protein
MRCAGARRVDAWWEYAFLEFGMGIEGRPDWEQKEVDGESISAMIRSVTVLR